MTVGALLRPSLRFVLPTTAPAPFAVSLRFRCPGCPSTGRAAGLLVPALLCTPTGLRLRLRFRLLRLRFGPLALRLPALLFATGLPFATGLLFATAPAVRAFVAAPRFRVFGSLLGMAAPLPTGFRVGGGDRGVCDRDIRQRKRTPDRDRAALSAPASQAARHVPARLRVPRRARGRS